MAIKWIFQPDNGTVTKLIKYYVSKIGDILKFDIIWKFLVNMDPKETE